MGRLLDALRVDSEPVPVATPATLATFPTDAPGKSQSRKSRSGAESENQADIRAHLLALAGDEGLPAGLVHRLAEADAATCAGLPDDTLRAYLWALNRNRQMERGLPPVDWQAVAHCEGCGPVHWHRAERLRACPWCFRRRAGKPIPRPLVRCGDCRHFTPDTVNPAAGVGTCAAGNAARWPMQPHRCPDMQAKQGVPA